MALTCSVARLRQNLQIIYPTPTRDFFRLRAGSFGIRGRVASTSAHWEDELPLHLCRENQVPD